MRNLILFLISIFSFLVYASLPPTRLKGGNEAALATTFNFDIGAMPVTRTGTSVVFGTLPVSGGGTGLTSLNAYNLLSGSGTTVNQIAPAASGTILFSTGASSFPAFRSLVGLDVTTALGYTPIASSAASIAEVLGYVPLASSTAAIKSTLGYEPVATVSAASPLLITGGASNPVVSLSTTGVASGASFAKVFVDGYGRVTSGTFLINADLPDSGVIASTYPKVTVNSKGIVTSGTTLSTSDLPNNGVISGTYTKVQVTSQGTVISGTTLVNSDLPNSGVTSGTYTKVQVDAKGVVTSGTTLLESDIPSLQTTKITSGVFGTDRGGTGFGTYSIGDLLVGSGTTLGRLPIGTNDQFLKVVSGSVIWSTGSASVVSAPTVQRFTSGSGTYTTPVGVKYISVSMIGGGGGGCGNGITNAGFSGSGTTFGTSLLTAGGGMGCGAGLSNGGPGGINTINAPAIPKVDAIGGSGGAFVNVNASTGGHGGNSMFGGGGGGGYGAATPAAGQAGAANTGGGGGGGGASTSAASSGAGGGGGGVIATIITPSASYSYVVGPAGGGGAAGAGAAGGAGGTGVVIVEEFY